MKIFEGKSPTERNKIIAATVLGVMALFVLTYTFGGSFFGSKTKINVKISPSPKPSASPSGATTVSTISQEEADFAYSTTPVYYNQNTLFAPEPGRNIFAFYEPPPPTPYSPTPLPTPTPVKIETPVPTPTPPLTVFTAASQKGAIYAGETGIRIDVTGDKFTPDSQIYINGVAVPTTFLGASNLTADIPSNYTANPVTLFITVQTPDRKFYSNQISLTIQPQPKPGFQYIGAVLRKGNNNNTAYIKEGNDLKNVRLNDLIGRFQVVSISAKEIVVKDSALGFVHRVPISNSSGQTVNTQNNPNNPTVNNQTQQNCIPGITCDNQNNPINQNNRTLQQQQQLKQQQQQKDEDDDGDN
ncbi:hypothetical protein BH10ACI1_BH10ACI1_18710 [soil metagenome]